MTLSQLQAFAAVARLGSVTAAARELGVSVPAVSGAIAALRRELGDELLARQGHGVALTPGGVRLAGAAAEILGIADQARRAVAEARGGRQLLRVAATHELAEYVTGPLVDAFTRSRPSLEVAVTTMPGTALETAVRERRADVALGPRAASAGLDSVPFLRARAVVVAAPSHALAGHRALHASALRAERWACGPEASDPTTPLASLVARLGVPAERLRAHPSHAAALAAVASGTGVAAALAHTVTGELTRGALVRLDVRGTPWESLWCATMLPLDRRSAVAATFGRFVATPDATQAILARSAGTAASRFRPPVYVTIWATDAASS